MKVSIQITPISLLLLLLLLFLTLPAQLTSLLGWCAVNGSDQLAVRNAPYYAFPPRELFPTGAHGHSTVLSAL